MRKTVFVDEQQVPEHIEIDDKEEEASHFIAYSEGHAVGAARMRLDHKLAKAERVCILPSHRGRGIGRLLMKEIEREAVRQGAAVMALNAQTHAADFYTALGYRIVSEEPFLDAGIPHVSMELALS